MAQGQHKPKSHSQLAAAAKKSAKVNKRVSRGIRIAPKSMALIKEKSMQKKLKARNIQNTERQISIKAATCGKLTILKDTAEKALKQKKDKEAALEAKKEKAKK